MIGPIFAVPVQPRAQENVPWAKPIRMFQFILVLVLFIFMCQIITGGDSPFGLEESLAHTTFCGTFLVVTLVDMISQCARDPIPDTPMFLFGILGALFFILAAIGIGFGSARGGVKDVWRFYVALIISIGCAILFLLDVFLIFLYGY